jgi:hypothetical protein
MQCERIHAFFAAWPDQASAVPATAAPVAAPAPAVRIAQPAPSSTGDAGRRTAERLARIRGDAIGMS